MCKTLKITLIFICIIGCWFLNSSAEVVTFKSSIIWSVSEGADYKLNRSSGGIYMPRETIPTRGKITSITANWKFEGEVTLEVSADGGSHYYPVTCGVPLKQGFVSGKRLRWRANISKESKLKEVKITYTDSFGVIASFGEPALSDFKLKKPIYIKNPSGRELFNYQVNIKVGESKESKGYHLHCGSQIKRDFSDIRFSAFDGETLLAYYKEDISGSAPKKTASFWVKIPQIPEEGVFIYIYYNNFKAQELYFDEDEVFDFFDDFKGDSLDEKIWSIKNPEDIGSVKVSNSYIELENAELISRDFKFAEGIIEYSATPVKGEETSLTLKAYSIEEDANQLVYSSSYNGAEHCIAVDGIVRINESTPISSGETYNYRVFADNKAIVFERYNEGFRQKQAQVLLEAKSENKDGHIGLKSTRAIREQPITRYDWVRVRKYANPEPYIDLKETKAQNCNLALFRGTSLSGNGNLILEPLEIAKGQTLKLGSYTSKKFSSPFTCRIIVSAYKGTEKGVFLDISSDNGKTYKRNCVNDAYYYASKSNFEPGRDLKYQFNFYHIEDEISQVSEISLDYRPGKITVISPNGGETLKANRRKIILWTAMDYEASYPISIEYSTDNGRNYTFIAKSTENDGKFLWKLQNMPKKEAILKISDALDKSIYDTSDGPFFIVE